MNEDILNSNINRFGILSIISTLFVIGISYMNVFKGYVADWFYLGIIILIVSILINIVLIILNTKILKRRGTFYITEFLLLLTVLTGSIPNLFLLITNLKSYLANKKDALDDFSVVLNKVIKIPLAFLGFLFLSVIIGSSVMSYITFDGDMAVQNNYDMILQFPSLQYPFGTDNFGRDVFSRIIIGARLSILISFVSTLISMVIGGIFGAISGFFHEVTDSIIMRALDVVYAIPALLLAIAIVAAFGPSATNLIIALSIGGIPTFARTMRANVLEIKREEYVIAGEAIGESKVSLLLRYIVPNAFSPMIVKFSLNIGAMVIAVSGLSYLGLGIDPQIPEWGNILRVGSTYLETNSYLAVFPGFAIMLLVLSFNFIGDALRDALDPKIQ